MKVTLGDFHIEDHSGYPKTLDVGKIYDKDAELYQERILSRRNMEEREDMLELELIMFHSVDHLCPISRQEEFKTFDKHVKIRMKSLQLRFMMEYMFRI